MAPSEWEDTEWLEVILKNWEEERRVTKITEVDGMSAGVVKGESYMSDMDRVVAKGILGNGTTSRTIPLILKRRLPPAHKATTSFTATAFKNEAWVYKNILQKYEQVITGTPLTSMWPKCFHISNDVIIMEDLKTRGYRGVNRRIGYNMDEAILIGESLARLHAMGIAATEQGLVRPSSLGKFAFVGEAFGQCYETFFSALAAAMQSSPWEPGWGGEVADRIRKAGKKLRGRLEDLDKAEGPLRVICHGDAWVCNQLLRYDINNNPLHTVFLDFQITNHSSFAWDLIYFTRTSLSKATMASRGVDAVIKAYANALSETLKVLNSETVAPSLEEIQTEMKRLELYSFMVTLVSRTIMVCDPSIVVPSDAFFHDVKACTPFYQDTAIIPDLQREINKAIEGKLI